MENKNRVKKVEKINETNSITFIDGVIVFITSYIVATFIMNKINKNRIQKESDKNHNEQCKDANSRHFHGPNKSYSDNNYNINESNIYKKENDSFYSLISKIDGFDTTIFKNNSKDLRIEALGISESLLPSLMVQTMGNFSFDKNGRSVIKIGRTNKKEVLPHELMHAASSVDNKNKKYLGFAIAEDNGNYIGLGLTEGYTELLTGRHFKNGTIRHVAYPIEVKYAKIIEYIVGNKKMANLYSTANLEGLIYSLEQYADRSEIIKFLANLDFLSKNWYSMDRKILMKCREYYIACNSFCRDLIIKHDYMNSLNNPNYSNIPYERAIKALYSDVNLKGINTRLHIKDVDSSFTKENVEELVRSQSLRKSL